MPADDIIKKLDEVFEEQFKHVQKRLSGTEAEILCMKTIAKEWFTAGARAAHRDVYTRLLEISDTFKKFFQS